MQEILYKRCRKLEGRAFREQKINLNVHSIKTPGHNIHDIHNHVCI